MASPLTVYSSNDGYTTRSSSSWATLTGSTTAASAQPSQTYLTIGVRGGSTDYVYQGFLEFDTSSIPDGATVTGATLSMVFEIDYNTEAYTLQARSYDWGGGDVTTADWRTPTQFNGDTLVATLSVAAGPSTDTRYSFTSEAAFTSAINKTGYTRLVLNAIEWASGTEISAYHYDRWYAKEATGTDESRDPKLIVTYTEATTFMQPNLYGVW